MIATTENKTYTRDEYLELEIASESRNEYRNGVIIPMTGGTPNHEVINLSPIALLLHFKNIY